MTAASFHVFFIGNIARGVGKAKVREDTEGREGFAPVVLLEGKKRKRTKKEEKEKKKKRKKKEIIK